MASSEELLQLAGFAADWKDWRAVAARLEDRELFGKAAEACAVGLRSGPNADLLASLVDNLERLGLTHEALVHLYELHALDPARSGIKQRLVRLSLLAGRPDIAVQFITDMPATLAWLRPQLQPAKEPALQFGYAFLLYYGGRYRDALSHFQSLQSMADWAIWAHSMAGLCHYRLGELFPSLDHFRQGLVRVTPDLEFEYRELYFNRACVLFVHGRLQATLASLEQLRCIDPDYPEVRDWIGEVRELIRNGGDDGPGTWAARTPRKPPPRDRTAEPWPTRRPSMEL